MINQIKTNGTKGGQYQNRGQFQNQGYNQNWGQQNWSNQGNVQPTSNVEKILEAFIENQKQEMQELRARVELLATQNKLLETQVAQQASTSIKPDRTLPSKPDLNIKDVKFICTLCSGTTYENPPRPSEEEVVMKAKNEGDQPSGKEHILQSEDKASKKAIWLPR